MVFGCTSTLDASPPGNPGMSSPASPLRLVALDSPVPGVGPSGAREEQDMAHIDQLVNHLVVDRLGEEDPFVQPVWAFACRERPLNRGQRMA